MILYQPINGYCYNSDTHFLYNFFKLSTNHYKNIQGELLDVGSGSGILGLLLARDYDKLSLNQCEIQKEFQFLSQKNSSINNIFSNIYCGSLFELQFDKQFDYIVSNPPFYHSNVIKSENKNIKIARYNDSMPLKNFIQTATKLLKNKGLFTFCYDAKQLAQIVSHLNSVKLNVEHIQFLHPKVSKESTLVMISARKNSKSLLKILPPMVMFNEDGSFTKNTLDIYEKCATYSIKCDIQFEENS
ncbi:MAG: methyltransferase [Campylobacterales bacterium]|nr:methyltransferase [Campylobacterales bacterium]